MTAASPGSNPEQETPMRLSDLIRFAAENRLDDPIVCVETADGLPVTPTYVDAGFAVIDLRPQPYVVLSPPDED